MKFYKIILWFSREKLYDFETRFASTQDKAKTLIIGHKDYELWEVTLKDKISKEDVVALLEGDSPGRQPQNMTPIDLVIDSKLIKRKRPKDATEKGHD